MKTKEKGSVTLIVLVTVLFIVILLSSFLVYINTKRRSQIGQTEEIENPTRLGYEFTGWKVSLGTIEGTTYTFGLGNATLEAGWNLITPTVENNIEIKANTENITPVTNETNITNVGAGPVSARKTDKQTLY